PNISIGNCSRKVIENRWSGNHGLGCRDNRDESAAIDEKGICTLITWKSGQTLPSLTVQTSQS
ncbi:hypothetical protein ACI4AF_28620, partial [Klebsiella pneumoniae]|uniref:hypothetical protein n=1 Tax=Klebsiella pneumoniae TaxID=573 RepID=UPI0038535C4B